MTRTIVYYDLRRMFKTLQRCVTYTHVTDKNLALVRDHVHLII